MESSGTGAEDHSNSGPSPGRNPFDLANILRSPPFTGSLSSAAAIYPPISHMPSAFSMLDPHPVFPGAALFPFGGLGSLGEGLMSAGVLGHSIGSAGNGADWWRAASEQANCQMTSDAMGPGAFYAGLNGTFGNSLFSPLFSSCISNASGATSSDSSSVNKSLSSATSSNKSLSSKSHKQSVSSSPIPKDSKEPRGRKEPRVDSDRGVTGNQENSSHMSSSRSSGKGGNASNRSPPEVQLKNSTSQLDYSLENSLLSAEAALYSASPFFFPFGAMAALSSAFGGMPFPGSSAMYSCPTTSPAYTSPFTMFPSHSSTSVSKMSATESPISQKSKSDSRTWTPVSRMSSAGTTSSTPGANTPKPNTPVSPGTPHRNRSTAISPCELGRKSGGDHRKDSTGTATSVIVSRGSSTPSTGSSARTLSISDHKMHLSCRTESLDLDDKNRGHISSPHKVFESKLRMMSTPDSISGCSSKMTKNNDRHSSTSGSEMFNDSSLYSLDGAIDLSIKKPRTESPARITATPTKSNTASKSSDYRRNSAAAGSLVSSSQADVLSALAHSHQMYAEHQAQLLANNQMAAAAAAAGLADPLSFNLAAAALLPQMYDGMTGLFYPPSALAAMAAASGVMSSVSPTEKVKSSRGRGRRRGLGSQQQQQQQQSSSSARNRGRSSSHFISSMMQMSKKPEESLEKKIGQGSRPVEGGSGVKSRSKSGKTQVLSTPISYFDAEERNRQDPIRQQLESEMQQQQHHHQLKLLQKMHQKKESSVSGASSDCGSGGHGIVKTGQNRKETLSSKLQHHQSKLAQALMGQDGLMTHSATLMASPLFKNDSSLPEHQLTSTEYDSSIRTDSDVDSCSSECSGMQTTSDGESHTTQGSDGGKSSQSMNRSKRKHEDDGGLEKKRQRVIIDEAEVRIPLEQHGWQRETRIHSFTPKKMIGEVVYVTPCGKTLHSCYEVEKHLEQAEIKDLSRENFTFSTKINLGKFFESSADGVVGFSQLDDGEVQERYAAIDARKRRILEKRLRAELREECLSQTEELSEGQLQKSYEQKELAKRVTEMKLKKRAEQQQQKEMLHRARQLQAMELKKSKEKQKVTKQQEKINRQLQIKTENEARQQQMNEEKEAKRQQSVLKDQTPCAAGSAPNSSCLSARSTSLMLSSASSSLPSESGRSELVASVPATSAVITSSLSSLASSSILSQHLGGTDMHYYSYLLHAAHQCQQQQRQHDEQERHKQMMAVLGLERERRRQQVLLVKAMDARKKEEEKERVKEEKKSAKKLDREKKLEQKRLELFLAREQKKPMEDMCITDGKPLPELERIHGVKLAGKAFADCLMVLEFAHNFAASLGLDNDSLPTMKILQCGLLNEDYCQEEFMSFVSHLVRIVLEDPGMANPKEAVLQSGQKMNDIEITNDNISELMRIFIRSRNGKEDDMTEWLKVKPFQSLNPTQKAAILAYLCNELLSSKGITGEIEKNIDGINNLRRDKWVIEGKVRKLRILQAKRFRKVIPTKGQQNEDSNTTTATVAPVSNKKDTDEEGEESGNDSDEAPSHVEGAHDSDAEEDQSISSEELEAKIEKLLKQQNQLREKVLNLAHKLSAVSFGQDRYQRRYWVLPKCGGIFVEGMESAEPEMFEFTKEEEEPIVANGEASSTLCQDPVQVSEETKASEQNEPVECKEQEDPVGEAPVDASTEGAPDTLGEAVLEKKDEVENSLVTSEHLAESAECSSFEIPDSFSASVPTTTVTMASVPLPASTPVEENQHSDPVANCCVKRPSDFVIQNLSDIVTQTVMNSLVQSPGPEDMNITIDSDLSLAQAKNEIKVKEEAGLQPEAMELFDANFMLKLEPKPFKLDGFDSEEKPFIKSETKDLVKDVDEERVDYIQAKSCVVSKMEKALVSENSSKAGAVLKPSVEGTNPAEMSKSVTNSILNFSTFYGNLLPCNVPSTTSAAMSTTSATTSFSSFRSIDSILQPDLKVKPNSIFASPVSSCSTSSTSPFIASSSVGSAELAKWNINRSIQNGTWFSIQPRVPCDPSTLRPTGPPSVTTEMLGTSTPRPVVSCPSLCSTPGSTVTACLTPTPCKQEMFADDLLATPSEFEMQAEYAISHQDVPPIPAVYQRGWWKISNPEQIKQLLACLSLRGIRERNLQKTLEKYLDYVCVSSTRAKKNVFKLESIVDEEPKSAEAVEGSGAIPAPAPVPDDKDSWNRELQRKMEVKVLEDIESMEERVCHASLQQGWKMSPRVTTNSSIELVSSYEADLKTNQRYILDAARSRLLFLEHNIERRYLKPPLGRSTQLNLASITTPSSKDNISSSDDDSDADEETATRELASWRSAVASATSSAQLCLYMMQLNKCIAWEKSIMKVSCQICCCDDNEAELLLCDICDRGYHTYCVKPKIESIPEGDWYCYECISKASGDTCCVVCGRHGNKLATCEFCRRRAHIDCLDPPLARMPKKWSCNSCAVEKGKMKRKQSRNVTVANVSSSATPASVTSTPVKENEKELNGNEKEAEPAEEKVKLAEENKLQDEDSLQTTPPSSHSSEKSTKSSKSKNDRGRDKSDVKIKKVEEDEIIEKEAVLICNGNSIAEEDMLTSQSVDMSICSTILAEMKKHQDAWPFLTPVSAKQFPTYRKVIRSPIDFKTMGRKLRSNVYKTPEEFATDARLVFNNCELFNEDDSSVGRAGHSMKLFFEKRWGELATKQ